MTFTPERSAAIRAGLITAAGSRGHRRRRVVAGAGLVLVGVLVGVGGSAAFAASGGWLPVPATPAGRPSGTPTPGGQPTPTPGAVEAPPGHVPGTPIVTVLGDPAGRQVTGPTELPLTDRPAGATHLRATITCLTAGTFGWGTDPGGNNPSLECGSADAGSGTAWYDFPLDQAVTALYITPPAQGEAAVSVQYLNQLPTRFGVNANGQTYGTSLGGPADGEPDLVLVIGTAPDGTEIEGYALASDLQAFSPDHPGQPANPEQAIRWQREREQRYPNGWDLPLYDSDGTTRIGSHHVG